MTSQVTRDEPDESLARVIAFHGHLCPGVTIGYRAARIAMRELKAERAEDEELVAICDTDACGVDAVQVITGCTAGKGNLFIRNWGKQVFTFGRRPEAKMIRVALRHDAFAGIEADTPEAMRQVRIDLLQTGCERELFDVRWVERELPCKAQIMRSIRCAHCGEGVMESKARLVDGEPLCPECFVTLQPER